MTHQTVSNEMKNIQRKMSEEFAKTWQTTFPEPVSVRNAIETTQYNPNFLSSLSRAIPSFVESPNPKTLTNWLAKHENLSLGSIRFVRKGHRWGVVESLTIAA